MYKITDKVIKFIIEAVKNWKVEMKTKGKTLAEVKIQGCIFLGNAPFTITICNGNNATQLCS